MRKQRCLSGQWTGIRLLQPWQGSRSRPGVIDGRTWPLCWKASREVNIRTPARQSMPNSMAVVGSPMVNGSLWFDSKYIDAFFYHGSQGTCRRAAPLEVGTESTPRLYDLEKTQVKRPPCRIPSVRKPRGMAIMFQEEMRRDARPAGRVPASPTRKVGPRSPVKDAGLNIQQDVVYATYGDRKLTMDLSVPRTPKGALPAIVSIHGGGWSKGIAASGEPVEGTGGRVM